MTRSDLGPLDTGARMRRLFGDSAVYGIAGAVSKLFALITFPLLARQLSVAEYGVVDVFLVTANWLALLVICGIDSAVARLMLDHADDQERAQVVSQSLLWIGLTACVVVVSTWWVAGMLVERVGGRPGDERIVHLICLQLPFVAVCSLAQGLLRWTFQRRRYLVLSLGAAAANALLLVALAVATTLRPHHVFVVGVLIQIGFAVLALHFIRRWLVAPRSLGWLRVALPMALPLGLVAGLLAALPLLERVLVGGAQGPDGLRGAQAIGLYAAGAKVASLLSLPIVAFQSGWGPFAVALNREQGSERTYNAALLVFTWGICLLVLALSAAGPWVVRGLASDRYAAGAMVVFPLAMALAVQAVGWMLEAGISISRRMHLTLAGYVALITVFVPLALLLRNVLGAVGVAFALLVGQCVFATVCAHVAQRAHPVGWRPGLAIAMLAVTLLAGGVQTGVGMLWGPLAATWVLGLALAAGLVVGALPGPIRTALTMLTRRRTAVPSRSD
jgi:O-antigen/teichoic acid export membrane protein